MRELQDCVAKDAERYCVNRKDVCAMRNQLKSSLLKSNIFGSLGN